MALLRTGLLLPALAGFTAGASHALSGPDHLAAVLPLAAEAPARAVRIGLSWALGHGLGTVLLTLLGLSLRAVLDLEGFGGHAELLVGVAVAVSGLLALRRVDHPHPHGHSHAALGLGTLHGVAGGTHVVAALSALALPLGGAVGWLGAFVLGAAVAMGGMGWLAQRVGALAGERRARRLRLGTAAGAVVVGAIWVGLALAGS